MKREYNNLNPEPLCLLTLNVILCATIVAEPSSVSRPPPLAPYFIPPLCSAP